MLIYLHPLDTKNFAQVFFFLRMMVTMILHKTTDNFKQDRFLRLGVVGEACRTAGAIQATVHQRHSVTKSNLTLWPEVNEWTSTIPYSLLEAESLHIKHHTNGNGNLSKISWQLRPPHYPANPRFVHCPHITAKQLC